jgi:hypothetical protein
LKLLAPALVVVVVAVAVAHTQNQAQQLGLPPEGPLMHKSLLP